MPAVLYPVGGKGDELGCDATESRTITDPDGWSRKIVILHRIRGSLQALHEDLLFLGPKVPKDQLSVSEKRQYEGTCTPVKQEPLF
jgi:hypothetical protein